MLKLLLTVALLMAMTLNPPADAAAQNRRETVDLLVLGGTIVTMDQTRRIIDDGGIGRVTSGACYVMSPGMEMWHPNPDFFFLPGGGPILDLGPYYIANLINLIGPVKRVGAVAAGGLSVRFTYGSPIGFPDLSYHARRAFKPPAPASMWASSSLKHDRGSTSTSSNRCSTACPDRLSHASIAGCR